MSPFLLSDEVIKLHRSIWCGISVHVVVVYVNSLYLSLVFACVLQVMIIQCTLFW